MKTRFRHRGVTLIDAIAALVILSIAMPTLVSSFVESASESIKPIQMTTAAMLALERMEEICARRHQTGGYGQINSTNFASETPVSGYTNYNRSVTITDVAADLTTTSAGSGIRKVVVTVTWNSAAKSVSVTRLFTDH